jgi:hypothetical protein
MVYKKAQLGRLVNQAPPFGLRSRTRLGLSPEPANPAGPYGRRLTPTNPTAGHYGRTARGVKESEITAGGISYDLRQLRLHGMMERMAGTPRYRRTETGLFTARFHRRLYQRVRLPGLSLVPDPRLQQHSALGPSFHAVETQLAQYFRLGLGCISFCCLPPTQLGGYPFAR